MEDTTTSLLAVLLGGCLAGPLKEFFGAASPQRTHRDRAQRERERDTERKRERGLQNPFLKFRRVTIRGAQPSARLSEEICLSEGSQGHLRGSLKGFCGVSAGLWGGPRDFRGSDPILVTLGNCWIPGLP